MAGIADFLDSLIGGLALICYSLTIGGLFWGLFVLRPAWNNTGRIQCRIAAKNYSSYL